MSRRSLAPFLLLGAALLWSLGGVLIKSIALPPMAVAGARSLIAIPVILICVGWPRFTFSRVQIGGAIAYAATVILFVFATRLTTAANAIFLQYTAPIYVAVIGRWYLRERALAIDWVVIAVALAGVALFFLDQLTTSGLWGNILALFSGFSFAALVLFLRRDRDASPISLVVLGNAIVAVMGAPFLFAEAIPSLGDMGRLLLLGVAQLGLSYVLYAAAIKDVTALEAILVPFLEPVLNPLWVMLALGERPGNWALLGGVCVLSAVLARGTLILRRQPG